MYRVTWRCPNAEWVSCSETTLERGAQVILNQVFAPAMVEDLVVDPAPNNLVPLGQYRPAYEVEARFTIDGQPCAVELHVWEVPKETPDPTYLMLHEQYIR